MNEQLTTSTGYVVHNPGSAPEQSVPVLGAVQEGFGFIPNIIGALAESPTTLKAYMSLAELFDKGTSLSPTEKQLVLLTISFENECNYCMAAHTAMAQMSKVNPEVVGALREGRTLADPKLEALRLFTKATWNQRGNLSPEEFQAFLDAGYNRAQALDVVTGIAQKTISNLTNHIMDTPLDKAFEAAAWTKP